MNKLKITIAALSVLAFGLLTACGDGLKANGDAQNNLEQINRPAEESPEAEASNSVLEDAVAGFSSVVERNESANPGMNRSMALNIDAMSLLRSDSYGTAGNTRSSLTLTMLFSCQSSDDIRLQQTVDLSRLENGEDVSISSSNPTYETTIRCTDSNCDGLVATIERNGPAGSTGVAHFAMEGEVTYTGPHGTLYEYNTVEASPRISNFFTKDTVAFYREACATADAERQLGIGGSGNATDDIFSTDGEWEDVEDLSGTFWGPQ